jgi:hypothetical protein
MHVEMWGSGVEFYAATPMYVVSNLYKRRQGSLFAPMPIELVKGVLSQIGEGNRGGTYESLLYKASSVFT